MLGYSQITREYAGNAKWWHVLTDTSVSECSRWCFIFEQLWFDKALVDHCVQFLPSDFILFRTRTSRPDAVSHVGLSHELPDLHLQQRQHSLHHGCLHQDPEESIWERAHDCGKVNTVPPTIQHGSEWSDALSSWRRLAYAWAEGE